MALLVGLFMLAGAAATYRGGLGEGDAAAIAAGLWQARLKGSGLAEPLIYMPEAHALYHLIWLHAPDALVGSADALTLQMNRLSWLASGLALGLLGLILLREHASRRASALALLAPLVALATSPIYFETSTYGHMATVSLAVTLAGGWLLLGAAAGRGRWRLPAALVLLEAALALRADAALLWPGLAALAWLRWREGHRQGRIWPPLLALALLPVLHVLAMALIFHGAGTGGEPLSAQLIRLLREHYGLGWLALGLAKSVLDAGPGLWLLAGLATAGIVRARRWDALAVGLALVLPVLVFHAGTPMPARHFLLLAVGLALGAGVMLARVPFQRPFWWLAAAILAVAGNLFSHVVTGPLAIPLAGRVRPEVIERLETPLWRRHATNQAYLDWDRERWRGELARGDDAIRYVGAWREYTALLLAASRAGHAIELERVDRDEGVFLRRLRIDGRQIEFIEWYPGRSPRLLEPPPQVVVVHPYAAEAMAQLPAARMSLPPPGLSFQYW